MASAVFVFVFVFFLVVAASHAHAKLSIDPSDLDSLKTVQKELGLRIVLRQASASASNPCSSVPGLVCERRISSSNNSYVLRVTRLVFDSQRLEGSISPAVGRLTELKELSLANNNLFGQLPSQLVNCKKLEILNLRNNLFTGEIPMEISSLVRLRELDLASNRFKGELSFLKHLPNIEKLNLSNNLFRGKVPASVRSFRNLRYFGASGNDFLKGPVLSLNDLDRPSSRIPRRFALDGTSGPRSNTTSAPAAPAPVDYTSPTIAPAPMVTPGPPKKGRSVVRKVAIGLSGFLFGGVAGTICGFVCCLLFKKILSFIRGEEKDAGPSIFSPLIKKADDLAFLDKEDAMQSLEVIGRGGCGIVYKAELPGSNGKMIAIKKIVQPAKDAAELTEEDSRALNKKMRQIRTEIRIVGEIRHKNLLPLLAHRCRPDCHYLVYEYMKNGSLQDLLEKVSQGTAELDWLTRHSIALGVAAGLEYLHFNHHKKVIHRDLKPANVLLDDDMEARIADFGLAKEMKEEDTHATSTNVVGTLGYIAPEYHLTCKFTEKSDVYSFGVLLASLVKGKLPSDNFFQSTQEIGIVKWLRRVMGSDNQKAAIDEKLMGNGYEEQMLLVLKVAYFCTLEDAKQRPNSKDVRCMLDQIKH
ncbi:hypothetical protein MLD38_026097 [Melastoma candidum]|uniref:Uncharacterized protein n=1 Tax=Melastoma candidum TaxID=119954 RepID=A0ACB9NXI4_9MYRT|nr:hypothetical protein MLD38_026097 [Melastoma candidum]